MTETSSQEPIFIHSLWRSGSTYVFNAFRRSGAGYWAYQEPIHEVSLVAKDDPDILLGITSEGLAYLRHPKLDKPYFYELQQTHQAWHAFIEKSLIYDDYFGVGTFEPLGNYFQALIRAANGHGRPVIQECRTSGRIGAIKRNLGGLHLYLWRNPWDQWWSFKLDDYFGAACQIILGARSSLPILAKLKDEIGYMEFHHESVQEEFRYYKQYRLTAENGYLVFYTLWCLGLLEGLAYADQLLNIDSLSTSQDYRINIKNQFDELGISGIDFSDCNAAQGFFDASDIEMFTRIENRVHGLFLVSGYSQETIDNILQLRSHHAVSIHVEPNTLQRDLHRAREIALRFESTDAGHGQYCLHVIDGLEAQAKSLENDLTTSKFSLEGLAAQLESKDTEIRNATETLALTKNELNQHLQSSQSYLQASQQSVLELTKSYAEREFALNQQLLAGKEELRRLEQAQAQFEKNQAEQISLAQQEQENLKRTLEQREQAMATQLLAMQQQAEREKAGQEKSHSEQTQLLQRQQDEREQILSQQLSAAHEELFKVQQDIVKREQLQSEQTSQTRQEVETLLLTLARREQEVAAELLAIQQQAELDKAQMAKSHSEQTNELHREHAVRKQTLKQQLKAGQEELRNLQQEHLKREHVLAEQTIQTRKELEHLLKALAQREQEVALQVLALKEEAEQEKAEQARIHAEQAQVIHSQHSKREKALNQQLHTKQQEIRNLQKDRIKNQREMMEQLLGMQQQASQEKAEQARNHVEQVNKLLGDQAEREQTLSQQLQVVREELHLVAQERERLKQSLSEQGLQARQELESQLGVLAQREQEFALQLQTSQQQAEQAKEDQARLHLGQVQALQSQHVEQEQALNQQLHAVREELHLVELERVRLEQLLSEQAVQARHEMENQLLILAQREQEFALQFLTGQQQAEQEKAELALACSQQEQTLQRQRSEFEQALTVQLQNGQDLLRHVEEERAKLEQQLSEQLIQTQQEREHFQRALEQCQQDVAAQLLAIQLQNEHPIAQEGVNGRNRDKSELSNQIQLYAGEILRLNHIILESNKFFRNAKRPFWQQFFSPFRFYHHAITDTNSFFKSMEFALGASLQNRGVTTLMQTINQINYQPDFIVKPDGIYDLSDFQYLYDYSFIRAAYLAILRREPDFEGTSYYLDRIRKGESRNIILAEIFKSPEAGQYITEISGLSASVFLEKICSLPILGNILLASTFLLNIKNHLQDLRALENHIIRMAEETQQVTQENIAKLNASIDNLNPK